MKSNIRVSANSPRIAKSNGASGINRNTISAYALSVVGIILVLNLCMHFDSFHSDMLFKGTSTTSFIQKLMLLTSAFAFFNLRRWRKDLRNGLVFVSALFMVAFLYKSNYWIEAVFNVPWYFPALKFVAVAGIVAFRGGFGLYRELSEVFASYTAKLILYAAIALALFMSTLHLTIVWQYLLSSSYSDALMHSIKEGGQLAIFIFITIESIKTRITLKKQA